MPWVYFGLSMACFVVVFRTLSLGLAAIALLVALLLMLLGTLALVSARISSRSRSAAALLGPEQIAAIKRRQSREKPAGDSDAGCGLVGDPGAGPGEGSYQGSDDGSHQASDID